MGLEILIQSLVQSFLNGVQLLFSYNSGLVYNFRCA
uniref:Uncharacterized protein n=1 Tax=Rhizophora mucronata TaxID=61149 RepID=A0A2P2NB73_RHIMU